MKLNKKRTLLIASAFFAILMLWQIYYFYVPLYLESLLENEYGFQGTDFYKDIIGHIMSLDNLAAILIIPLFGWLSDHTRTRNGRRIPYIIWGMVLSLALFPLVSAMFLLNKFMWYFITVIALVVAMAAFRAPAVSLMPDTTPKPLRTSANAIINFIGYLGAILGAGLTIIFTMQNETLTLIPFAITSVVMMLVIVALLLRFNENHTVAKMQPLLAQGESQSDTHGAIEPGRKLTHIDKRNFGIIIGTVFLCFFAFNALQTFASLYGSYLGTTQIGLATTTLAIASLVTFIPTIWLTRILGRKWSTALGLAVVLGALIYAATQITAFGPLLITMFGVAGMGFAIVMVNAYPMFIETASSQNVGRITGLYYLVSQLAMFITSNVSGYVFKWLGMGAYFWYAIIFISAALFLVLFFQPRKRHFKKFKPCREWPST